MKYKTGFFGVPGSKRGRHTVHIADERGQPICGNTPHKDAEFQGCASRIVYSYLDCETCKKKVKAMWKADEAARTKKLLGDMTREQHIADKVLALKPKVSKVVCLYVNDKRSDIPTWREIRALALAVKKGKLK